MYREKKHNTELLKLARDVSSLVDIHYIRQKEPNGLGDAVFRAEKHIENEPLAVLLGGDIIVHDKPCTAQLIENFEKYGRSTLAVEEVPYEKLSSYGIIKGKPLDGSLYLKILWKNRHQNPLLRILGQLAVMFSPLKYLTV